MLIVLVNELAQDIHQRNVYTKLSKQASVNAQKHKHTSTLKEQSTYDLITIFYFIEDNIFRLTQINYFGLFSSFSSLTYNLTVVPLFM